MSETRKRHSVIRRRQPLAAREHWEELRAQTVRRVDKLARMAHDEEDYRVALRAYDLVLRTSSKVVDQYLQTLQIDKEAEGLDAIKGIVREIEKVEDELKDGIGEDIDRWVALGDKDVVH
jgi:hypothetical protein